MKQFLLGLSVSFAFIAGCIAATVAQSQTTPTASAAPEGFTRWEYSCPDAYANFQERANQYGAAGWEMVTAHERSCYKRRIR